MSAQKPDLIVIGGETLKLYSNPLEEFWIKINRKRPEFCPQPYCQRGYVATWEIESKKLFLINVDGFFLKRSFLTGNKVLRYTMQTLFTDYTKGRVLANWFSGKLRIPTGPMRQYVHTGYESRFEKEILLTVEEGDITKEVLLDFANQTLVIQ